MKGNSFKDSHSTSCFKLKKTKNHQQKKKPTTKNHHINVYNFVSMYKLLNFLYVFKDERIKEKKQLNN